MCADPVLMNVARVWCAARVRRAAERVAARAQSTKFMLGIILAVLCSNWVGEVIHSDGIYETDLDADGSVIFLRPSPPPALFAKDAGMIMSRAVWCAPCCASPASSRGASCCRTL